MRALHIGAGNLYGGIETMLCTLAAFRAASAAVEHEFAVSFDGRLAAALRDAAVSPHLLGPVRLSRPHSVWNARKRLATLVGYLRPDVLLCHGHWTLTAFGSVARQSGVPIVMWVHGPPTHPRWLDSTGLAPRPDLLIANGPYIAGLATDWLPTVNTHVLHYPVTDATSKVTRGRNTVREELETPQSAVVIVLASRMEAWKGHADLIRALISLRDDSRWVCWIAGGVQRPSEAAYLSQLRSLVSEGGIADRVRFCGDRRDVADLLSAADIYCQPNPVPEPFGISFIEAMYCALPVVATGVGGPASIVTAETGLLVRPREPAEVAAALACLVDDAGLRARLGMAGRTRAIDLCEPRARVNELGALLTMFARRGEHPVRTGSSRRA